MENLAKSLTSSHTQVNFLIVEDEKAHSRLITRYLEETKLLDANITVVSTLKAAKDFLQSSSPDIMFVDVRLPDGQGIDLLQESRQDFPIVVMTNFGNEQLAVDVLKLGALDYVVKSENLFREIPQITIRVLREWNNLVEKKASEAALKESEELFRQLATNINDVFWLFDPIANKTIYVSPAYEKIWGKPINEVYKNNNTWHNSIHPDDKAWVLELTRTMGMVKDFNIEYRILNQDNQVRWIRDRSKIIKDNSGNVYRIAGIAEDITERKIKDQELEQYRNHLEDIVNERTQELESFCYSVSHDLRAPLRSIDGFSNIILEDYKDLLDENGKDNLQRIRNNIQKMSQLIDDLLLLSRVSREELSRSRFNMSEIASKISTELKNQNGNKNIEFQIEPDIFVNADINLMHIVLENLLNNALKFTSQSEKPVIKIGVNKLKDGNEYFVKDNGVGFDMKYIDKLFQPFSRLHHATDFPGTGIGLATVKRIINRHSGKVWATSEINNGATIYFTLGQNDSDTINSANKQLFG